MISLDEPRVVQAAHMLLDARARRTRLAQLPADLAPRDTAHAEAICEAMARGLERPIGGWKVGGPDAGSPTKQGLEGPFCGCVPARFVYPSGASVHWSDLLRPVAEAEIAFRLGRDLPARARPRSRAEVASAVDAVLPAIEIPESRLRDDHPHGALGMVADQGYAGRLVCGLPVAPWRERDLVAQPALLRIAGRVVAQGTGARAMGDPLEALCWLANHRGRRGDGLAAGQVVSTGSLTGIHWTRAGDRVAAEFPGLGSVELFMAP